MNFLFAQVKSMKRFELNWIEIASVIVKSFLLRKRVTEQRT